jgi:DDE superfamily endonuclease
MLQESAAAGEIILKYLDESGCCLWSEVSYCYSLTGKQKYMEQTLHRYGSRISILGIWEPDQEFDYALAQKGFKSDSYLKVMAWQAQKAEQSLITTNRLTVLVQDNAPIHTSQKCKAQWLQWQQQGLFLFQLPKYSSEMNPIETEWHQLKTHEIAGRMFDNEYDLALSIMDGMYSRAQQGKYALNRFQFNSG